MEQGDIVAVSVAMEHLDANNDWVVGVTRGTVLHSEHGRARKSDLVFFISSLPIDCSISSCQFDWLKFACL